MKGSILEENNSAMKRTKALKKQATDNLKKKHYKISYFIFINLKTPSDKTYFDIYKIYVT